LAVAPEHGDVPVGAVVVGATVVVVGLADELVPVVLEEGTHQRPIGVDVPPDQDADPIGIASVEIVGDRRSPEAEADRDRPQVFTWLEQVVAANVDVIFIVMALDADLALARRIASAVRERDGGLPAVRAMGVAVEHRGLVQVSMNVVDVKLAPLHEVVERVREEAAARGVEVATGELVGLVPESVLGAAVAAKVVVPGVDASQVLEHVLASRLAE
jgi:glutamate formiminotransferase